MGESKRRSAASASGLGTKPKTKRRFTWKVIVFFLLAMLVLDVILFLMFRYGFDACYGVLCLME